MQTDKAKDIISVEKMETKAEIPYIAEVMETWSEMKWLSWDI